jgi:hypothetical protein
VQENMQRDKRENYDEYKEDRIGLALDPSAYFLRVHALIILFTRGFMLEY